MNWGNGLILSPATPCWSPYNYVMGNPLIFVDPTGKGVETKFVDVRGKVLADIDDGSDAVFVVQDANKKDLMTNLLEGMNNSFTILDSKRNAELGNKFGFALSELAEHSCPECAFQADGRMESKYRAGYSEGYDGKRVQPLILGDQKSGGSSYLWGRSEGQKDKANGHMNTFDPKIKDNTPFLKVSDNKDSGEVGIEIFGVQKTVADFESWINKLYTK